MKKKNSNSWHSFVRYFMAIVMFLSFSVKFDYKEVDGPKFKFRRTLVPRLYSPVFWFVLLLIIILTLGASIYAAAREWLEDNKDLFKDIFKGESGYKSMKNEFLPEISKTEQKFLLWRYIYWE